jgi:hypothetical protein
MSLLLETTMKNEEELAMLLLLETPVKNKEELEELPPPSPQEATRVPPYIMEQ